MTRRPLLAVVLLTLAACTAKSGEQPLQGYVEGDYVYVSAEANGRLIERPAEAGRTVGQGAILARLDDSDQVAAIAVAEARLAQARAQLANLRSGKRPEEISVIAAALAEAKSAIVQTEDDYRRKLTLREKGFVAQAAVDDARAKRDAAQAQVDSNERQLDVARLPARAEEIDAAERNVAALEATLTQAKIALDRRSLTAPDASVVEETYFEPGELVAAGQAVVSLLPDANKKIRFFLPEPLLATVKVGDRVRVGCDNCGAGLEAAITFIASQSQFTPPVIYSKDNREKLVFRTDAMPLGEAANLKVGQPLDIVLNRAGAGS
jgi:HlyD family secretion protein